MLWEPEHKLGDLYVKEGRLTAGWHRHEHAEVGSVSVGSDPVYGPMIGLLTYTPVTFVKIGSLTAGWHHEYGAAFAVQVAD